MDWQQTTHNPPLTILFWNLVREPGAKSPAEFQAAHARTERAMDILEEALAHRPWLGGQSFTMADCVMAPGVHRYLHLPMELKPRAHVRRYYDAIMQRPAAQKLLTLPLT